MFTGRVKALLNAYAQVSIADYSLPVTHHVLHITHYALRITNLQKCKKNC